MEKAKQFRLTFSEELSLATYKQRAIVDSILKFKKPSEKQKALLKRILEDIRSNKDAYQKKAEKVATRLVTPVRLVAEINSKITSSRLSDWDRKFINTVIQLTLS